MQFGGGGALLHMSNVGFERCTFEGNISGGDGGGLNVALDAIGGLQDCTLVSNESLDGMGGAIHVGSQGGLHVVGCTLVDNATPGGQGAGLSVFPFAQASLENTIVAHGRQGQAVYIPDESAIVDLSCCDIYGNQYGDWTGPIASQLGVDGNIAEDPLFCGDLNPNVPYSLDSGSPCMPFTEPNPDCELIGAWEVGCGVMEVTDRQTAAPVQLTCRSLRAAASIDWAVPMRLLGAEVGLTIHDLCGRRVTSLVKGVLSSNGGSIGWNGTNEQGQLVPSGVYFVRFSAGNRTVVTRPLVIIR